MKLAFMIYIIIIFTVGPALAHHGKGPGKDGHPHDARYCHHEPPPVSTSVSIAKAHSGICGLLGLCW